MKIIGFGNDRNLNLFVFSQLFSIIGERISIIAFLNISDYINRTDVYSYLQTSTAMSIAPVLFLSLLGGLWADKFNRKRFLVLLNILRITTLLFFLFSYSFYSNIYYLAIAVIGILGIFTAISNPIKKSTIPFLINSTNLDLTNANNFLVTIEVVAMVIGLGLGTLLSYYFNPFTLLYFDALFFLIGIILLIYLKQKFKPTAQLDNSDNSENFSLLNYISKDKTVNKLIMFLVLPFYFSAGLFYSGVTIWASNHKEHSGRLLSFFFLFLAIGAIISHFIVKRYYQINQYLLIAFSYIFASLLIVISTYLQLTNFIYVILVFLGMFIGCLYNLSISLFQKTVKPTLLGRVMSLNEILFGIMFIFGVYSLKFLQIETIKWSWFCSAIILAVTAILILCLKLNLKINETELGERTTRCLQKQG